MVIVDNELVGLDLIENENKFSPSCYVPKVNGQNVDKFIEGKLAVSGDKPWMTDFISGKSMNYSELPGAIRRVSRSLRKKGLCPRQAVFLISDNCVEIPLIFFATWKAGGYCASLEVNMLSERIREYAMMMKPRFIFTDQKRKAMVLAAVQDLDIDVITLDDEKKGQHISFSELFQEECNEEIMEIETDLDAPAWMTFSSGTTGISKPIIHSHRSLSPYLQMKQPTVLGENFVFTNYMFHGSGLYSFLRTMGDYVSGYTFSCPTTDAILNAIGTLKPSYVNLLPFQLAEIYRYPNLSQFSLDSVETITSTGSSLQPGFELELFNIFPNLVNLLSIYGCSEMMLLAMGEPKPRPPPNTPRDQIIRNHVSGSVGNVCPFVKIRILDLVTGEKLGPGKTGEIIAWSPFKMLGYYNKPEETLKAFSDGWYRVGDRGHYDEEGNLFVEGRMKDLIKYRNISVIPSEIEKQMLTHPSVTDAVVVGLPHEIDGEQPTAFVVVRKGPSGEPLVTKEELAMFTNAKVTADEQLRGGVRFIDEIPRNTLGKVLRTKLVETLLLEAESLKLQRKD